MPTKHPIKQRAGLWRVWYTIEINGNKKRRSKSVKSIQEADTLMLRLAANVFKYSSNLAGAEADNFLENSLHGIYRIKLGIVADKAILIAEPC